MSLNPAMNIIFATLMIQNIRLLLNN